MPKYKVEVKLIATFYETVEVEAEDDSDAEALAIEEAFENADSGDFAVVDEAIERCYEIKEQEEKDND